MRDNILVNPSGLDGHAMGIDLNIEHLIVYLKVINSNFVQNSLNANQVNLQGIFAAKGIYSNWD